MVVITLFDYYNKCIIELYVTKYEIIYNKQYIKNNRITYCPGVTLIKVTPGTVIPVSLKSP